MTNGLIVSPLKNDSKHNDGKKSKLKRRKLKLKLIGRKPKKPFVLNTNVLKAFAPLSSPPRVLAIPER
jgi:hypothetical protein